MDNQKTQKALEEIGYALLDSMEIDDLSIRLVRQELGWKGDQEVLVERSGNFRRIRAQVNENMVMDLRDATTEPGTGAWFKATIIVYPDGRLATDFDYESQPDFDPLPILAEDLIDELKNWPRTSENIPEWFRAKMIELGVSNPRE